MTRYIFEMDQIRLNEKFSEIIYKLHDIQFISKIYLEERNTGALEAAEGRRLRARSASHSKKSLQNHILKQYSKANGKKVANTSKKKICTK